MGTLFTMLTGLFPQNWSEIGGIGSNSSVGITFDTEKKEKKYEKRGSQRWRKRMRVLIGGCKWVVYEGCNRWVCTTEGDDGDDNEEDA